jgi:uncharacterized membrane protein YfcA
VIETVAVGVAAGLIAGLLGVGGGILMVPALVVFLNLSQIEAEATSLLAIVPTALVGSWRQSSYGNVRWRDALMVGGFSVAGGAAGVAAANALPERVLRLGFAAVMLMVAAQLVRRTLSAPGGVAPESDG